MNRLAACFVAGTLAFVAACSSPTQPLVFAVSCPVSQSLVSTDGAPVPATFAAPTPVGGQAPVTTTCSHASGSRFPVGSTGVTCTASDGAGKTATCSFEVQVRHVPPAPPTPRLSATRFVAFGDSITEGTASRCSGSLSFAEYWNSLLGVRPPPVDFPTSYPNRLRQRLAAQYTAQTFTVINEGSGGESIATGAADLGRVLTQDTPQAVLLMEGANDMNSIPFSDPDTVMDAIVARLRDMIRLSRSRGVVAFAATLTPQRVGACKAGAPTYMGSVNDRIRFMVAGEDATLVDIYSAFGGFASTELIGIDGLHPSDAGYQKIADTFFDAIRRRLEN